MGIAFWWWEGYILPKPLRGPLGKAARRERSRAGLSKISFLCRLPELPNVGRPQLPLPVTQKAMPDGIAFWWWEGYILPKPLRGPLGKAARRERSRAGLSKISFLCRLPELPNVGRPQLPLPVTQKAMPDGYRLLVVGRVHIAENPEGSLGKAARRERSRAGLSKISFLCRLPELPNVGRPQLPLPVTQKAMPDGYRLLVVGRGRFELPKS